MSKKTMNALEQLAFEEGLPDQAQAQAVIDAQERFEARASDEQLRSLSRDKSGFLGYRFSDLEAHYLETIRAYLTGQGVKPYYPTKPLTQADAVRYAIMLTGILVNQFEEESYE